jgi:hypothetical protein
MTGMGTTEHGFLEFFIGGPAAQGTDHQCLILTKVIILFEKVIIKIP